MSSARLTVAVLLALAGCQPADPLEWKVRAKSPADYYDWIDETVSKLDEATHSEYARAVRMIVTKSGAGRPVRSMREAHHPLCERSHGRTIRAVIIEGYGLETQALLQRIALESDHVVRNIRTTERISEAATEQKFARTRDIQLDAIERMNARLREIETRVKVLERRGDQVPVAK